MEANRAGIQSIIDEAIDWEKRSGATSEVDKTTIVQVTCSAIDQPPSVLSTPTATALPRVRMTLKTVPVQRMMALGQDAWYKKEEGQSHKKRRIMLTTR
ncbi:hypothetical protein Purlil1_13234 [Purpureocillium lilacinum]|uniref:Uncharacterized protein n=1 Tax=Purpureocillium lilacinum TaxID=33203 RepID=A0ABR0BEU8_PURLI|nr:hypothetical protein Purlil1_13234 [Purpureocillium lilacinum]